MERYHAFNSALLGLVAAVLVGQTKIRRTVRGLLRLTLLGVRYFFSGCERDPTAMRIVSENGGLMFLMSYFWLRQDVSGNWLRYLEDAGVPDNSVLLDSGAYSIARAEDRGKTVEPIDIEEYAAFIRQHRDRLFGWFNLDVIGDAAATRRNYEEMCAEGVPPIPVWGITDDIRDLDRYVEEDQEIIGIGGVALMLRRSQKRKAADLLRRVMHRHPNQNFHLLGCAYMPILKEFMPAFADSASPVTAGGNHKIVTEVGQRRAPEHFTKHDCTASSVRNIMTLEELRIEQSALAF